MPEDNLASESLPEKPAETTAQNETPGQNPPVDKTGLAEKIRRIGGSVFETAGKIVKRGRGRPKNCKLCGLPETQCACGDDPAGNPEDDPAGDVLPVESDFVDRPALPAPPVPDFQQKLNRLFGDCIGEASTGIPGGCAKVTRFLALKAGISEDFTEKTLARAEPTPKAQENLRAAVELVIDKHAPQIKEGGEWACLGLAVAQVMAPHALLWVEFIAEIKRKNARENSGGAK